MIESSKILVMLGVKRCENARATNSFCDIFAIELSLRPLEDIFSQFYYRIVSTVLPGGVDFSGIDGKIYTRNVRLIVLIFLLELSFSFDFTK